MSATSKVMIETFMKYHNRVFVETGSYLGDGIQKALDAGFERVYSIELSEKYYNHCVQRFSGNNKVVLMNGDSSVCLNGIIECDNEPVTFWLDAHYSGEDTAIGKTNTPLLKELDLIKSYLLNIHTILIDDLRGWSKEVHGFDTFDLMKIIKGINRDYWFTLENGFQQNDILIAQCLYR